MDKNKSRQLTQLIECSNMMLKDAESGNWDEVVEAEELRQDLIKALFATPAIANDAREISVATKEIMRINEMLKNHTLKMMYRVNSGIDSIHKGRTAVSAYQKNTG